MPAAVCSNGRQTQEQQPGRATQTTAQPAPSLSSRLPAHLPRAEADEGGVAEALLQVAPTVRLTLNLGTVGEGGRGCGRLRTAVGRRGKAAEAPLHPRTIVLACIILYNGSEAYLQQAVAGTLQRDCHLILQQFSGTRMALCSPRPGTPPLCLSSPPPLFFPPQPHTCTYGANVLVNLVPCSVLQSICQGEGQSGGMRGVAHAETKMEGFAQPLGTLTVQSLWLQTSAVQEVNT